MKHYKRLRLLFLFLLGIILYSCQNEIEDDPKIEQTISEELANNSDGQIILGEKLQNPYSVKNMRLALNNLKEQQKSNVKKYGNKTLDENFEIQTTHYYVKFWIENNEQKEVLLADSLILSIVPLDVEIEQEGDYLVDENLESGQSQWSYSCVDKDYQFHPEITYEIIEELFLIEEPTLENDKYNTTAKKFNVSKSFLFDLEDEALKITDNYTEIETTANNGGIARRSSIEAKGNIKHCNKETRWCSRY